MVWFLALALAQTPADPAPGVPAELVEPMRFGERSFGLDRHPTWTVYQGRHYLTAPQFAERVGDEGMVLLLALEKRRQTRSAVILVLGGNLAATLGPYVIALGTLTPNPRLAATLVTTGTVMAIGGAAAYYGAMTTLLVRVPRRNRVDLYYERTEASGWVEGFNARPNVAQSGRIELSPAVGPAAIGVVGRF